MLKYTCDKCGAVHELPAKYNHLVCTVCEHVIVHEPETKVTYEENSKGKNARPEAPNKTGRKRPMIPTRFRSK